MKKIWLLALLSAVAFGSGETRLPSGAIIGGAASIGSNSSADSKSVLDLSSTTKGFLAPRMTTTQKNAISSPTTGLLVYDSTLNACSVYTGAAWIQVASLTGTETFTNKSIDAATNTLTNIGNSSIAAAAGIVDTKLATIATAGKVSNSATTATASNTASTIMLRDGSGQVAASTFTGAVVGNADTATTATNGSTVSTSSNASFYPLFSSSSSNGAHAFNLGTGLTFNPSTNTLATTNFSGALAGNSSTATALAADPADCAADRYATTIAASGALTCAQVSNAGLAGSIAASKLVGSDIATVGTIISGTWNGTAIGKLYGGTGADNSSVTFPSTGTIPTTASTSTFTNKTQGDALTFTQIATPASPSAGFNKIYSKSDNKFYALDSSGNETAIGSGSGGGVNYIVNPDAESGTTGWATYADAAQNIPVDGTGGSPSSTWTRTTTTPLVGTGAFLWTRTANNRQGEGVSYDFSISNSQQSSVQNISFDYKNVSGTFVASDGITTPLNDATTSQNAGMSDLEVFIYDVTNSALIPVSPQVLTSTSTTTAHYKGTFQTASNSTSYRLILHTARSTAVAFTEQFDNFSVGPQATSQGSPISDWTTYTPTGSWVSNTTYAGRWRRVGNMMEVEATVTTSGAPTSAQLTIGLPSGYTIDTSSPLPTVGATGFFGTCKLIDNGGSFYQPAIVSYNSTTTVQVLSTNVAGTYGSQSSVDQATPFTWGSTDTGHCRFSLPISGWGAATLMSNETDTRVVAASIGLTSAQAVSSNAVVKYDTVITDTHGCYSASTGLCTIQVSGNYRMSVVALTGTTSNFYVKVNGTAQGNFLTATGGSSGSGSFTYPLIAGDTVGVYIDTGGTLTAKSGSVGYFNRFSIERLSGPSAIAATETVAASIYRNANQTGIASSTDTTLAFDTKNYDTHGFCNVSTGICTVPVAGKYHINSGVVFNSGNTWTAGGTPALYVNKNGTNTRVHYATVQTSTTTYMPIYGSDTLNLSAGDTVKIVVNQVSSGAIIALGGNNPQLTFMDIERIGN
jgi:hypothetical protein